VARPEPTDAEGLSSAERAEREALDRLDPGEPEPDPVEMPAPSKPAPPATVEEARQRYFARYGDALGGDTFYHVRRFFVEPQMPEPESTEDWVKLAERTRDELRARDETLARGREALSKAEQKAAAMAPQRPARRPVSK
jgi:hypothetical protein